MSTATKKRSDERFLGIFLQGLVWDDEHLAFVSLNPTPQYAWGMVTAYWIGGALIGLPYGYYQSERLWDFEKNFWVFTESYQNFIMWALMVGATVYAQWDYYGKTNNGKRPFSIFSLLVMPLFNGIFETFYFFYFFDLGVNLTKPYTDNKLILFTVGFHLFSIYSGLIHAVMWGAHVLPADYDAPRTGGERTKVQSQTLLFFGVIPMSFAWLVWYYVFEDAIWIILCHIYADMIIATSVHLPAPWATRSTDESKKLK